MAKTSPRNFSIFSSIRYRHMEDLDKVTGIRAVSYRLELSCFCCELEHSNGKFSYMVFEGCRSLTVDWSCQIAVNSMSHSSDNRGHTITASGGKFCVTYGRAYRILRNDIPEIIQEIRKFC